MVDQGAGPPRKAAPRPLTCCDTTLRRLAFLKAETP